MTLSKPTFGTAYATSETFVSPPELALSSAAPASSLEPPQALSTARATRAARKA